MNIQELLGEAFKEGMSIDEINLALADKNFVDPSKLPPTVSKVTYDKAASELAKIKKELSELKTANLTDEQKLQQALANAKKKEEEFNRKSILLDVEKVLVQGGLEEKDYTGIVDSLVTNDRSASISLANNLVAMLDSQKQAAAQAVKNELQKSLIPPKGSETEVSKETFDKMSVSEKMKFKIENPDTYKEIFGGN